MTIGQKVRTDGAGLRGVRVPVSPSSGPTGSVFLLDRNGIDGRCYHGRLSRSDEGDGRNPGQNTAIGNSRQSRRCHCMDGLP